MCCRFRSELHSFGALESQVEWNISKMFSIVLLHPHTRTLSFFEVFEGSKALTVGLYLFIQVLCKILLLLLWDGCLFSTGSLAIKGLADLPGKLF